jgi:hypothetical protein
MSQPLINELLVWRGLGVSVASKQRIIFDPRSGPRRPLEVSASLAMSGLRHLKVRVFDISPEGFRASCVGGIKGGSVISLEVPGLGAVPARVLWIQSDEFGAKFMRRIDAQRCGWLREA